MRSVFLSFLLTCLFTLTGSASGYAAFKKDSNYPVAQKTVKTQQNSFECLRGGLSFRKNTSLNANREDFISVEDDDEQVVSWKQVLPAKLFTSADYASLLVNFHHYQKNRLPFCTHFSYTSSYKYILQRVLRI
jgi:hypothetical protein